MCLIESFGIIADPCAQSGGYRWMALERARRTVAERVQAPGRSVGFEQAQIDQIDIDGGGELCLRLDQRFDDLAKIFGMNGRFHAAN